MPNSSRNRDPGEILALREHLVQWWTSVGTIGSGRNSLQVGDAATDDGLLSVLLGMIIALDALYEVQAGSLRNGGSLESLPSDRPDLAKIALLKRYYVVLVGLLQGATESPNPSDLEFAWHRSCCLEEYQELLRGLTAERRDQFAIRGLVDLYGWLVSLLKEDLSVDALGKLGIFEASVKQHLMSTEKGWGAVVAEKAALGLVVRSVISKWDDADHSAIIVDLETKSIPCHATHWAGVWVTIHAEPPFHSMVKSLEVDLDPQAQLEISPECHERKRERTPGARVEFDLRNWNVRSARRRIWVKWANNTGETSLTQVLRARVRDYADLILGKEFRLKLSISEARWDQEATQSAIRSRQGDKKLAYTSADLTTLFPGVTFDPEARESIEALLHGVQGTAVLRIYRSLESRLRSKAFPFIHEGDVEAIIDYCDGAETACARHWKKDLTDDQKTVLACLFKAMAGHDGLLMSGEKPTVTLGELVAVFPEGAAPDAKRLIDTLRSLEGAWIRSEAPGVVYGFSSDRRRRQAKNLWKL